jgi:parallel beta-helix repeat protein
MLKISNLLLFLCVISSTVQAQNVSAQEIKQDFDLNSYDRWEDRTVYSKTYYVSQTHPDASDDNPGTVDRPFLTVGKAVCTVMAGERVIIGAGVYREMPVLKNQGLAEDRMISIEAAPGENVVIRGSRPLQTQWCQNPALTDAPLDSSRTYTWSRRIWFTSLPDSLFENNYYPFRMANILPEQYKQMPWAWLVKDFAPYKRPRAMLFQNDQRMTPLAHSDDLMRIPGSFYVAPDGKTVFIHPFGGKNPNSDCFEVGVQSHLFKPEKTGFGYIRLAGLTFEHCANGFLVTSTGAVTTLCGHHWIIENNIIRHNNSSGLEIGNHPWVFEDTNFQSVNAAGKEESQGNVIVRNNTVYDCGTAGIRGYTVTDGIIENNEIHDCGWQDAENYWEVAGIKLHRTRHTLLKGNYIHNIQGGNGIWLDWDCRYSRVTENNIHDIQTIQGGVFVEASLYPNLVDNNYLRNIDGNGVLGNDTELLTVTGNLIANTSGHLVSATTATARYLNNRLLKAGKAVIKNNIFINGEKSIRLDSDDNTVDSNLYVTTPDRREAGLDNARKCGFDSHGQEIRADSAINDPLAFIRQSAVATKYRYLRMFSSVRASTDHTQQIAIETRHRVPAEKLPAKPLNVRFTMQKWDPVKTAIIVCDMWDSYRCPDFTLW